MPPALTAAVGPARLPARSKHGGPGTAAPDRRPWLVALVVFVVAVPLWWGFYSRHPLLYDTDAAYHLAIARATSERGVLHELPAVRRSALTLYGFSDNVLGFHLLLAPFAVHGDPLAGGRLALALLDAAILAIIAGLAWRAVGRWSLLAPLAIGLGSLEVFWRLVRLRPELLALVLLLLALAAAGTRRFRLLGAIAALFALSYVAWHAFLGLFLLLFGFRGWARKSWDWPLALYPLLGSGLGLLVHPAFPANLLLWKLASFDVLASTQLLDRGSELGPASPQVILLANLGYWAVATILWRSRRADPSSDDPSRSAAAALADAFGLAALCFGALYLLASRFALYAYPFALLWLLFRLAARGEVPGSRLRLPFRGSVPTAAALLVAALLAVPGTAQELARFARRTNPGPHRERLADAEAFGRAVPTGATIASPWGETALYLLWAPQGRYLNVLDPTALAVPFPHLYEAQRAVFAGDEPDVPLVSVTALDSRYLAWSLPGAPPRLLHRLTHDPRARPLHLGFQALFALSPPPPGSFVLDWQLVPRGPLPPPASAVTTSWPAYPRLREGEGREMEGFVDSRRVARGCVALSRAEAAGESGRYELAASGPTRVWRNGELLLTTGGNGAVLGEGVGFRLAAAGRLTILTCPGTDGRTGFYLLRRE